MLVVKVATPLAFKEPVPSIVESSSKVTVPVGVPEVAGVTVALNVTASWSRDGFAEETSVTDVPALSTVCIRTGDVLPLKSSLPPYTAVFECTPRARVEVVNAASPSLTVAVPSVTEPFLKVTVPVGAPEVVGLTLAVNVTAS